MLDLHVLLALRRSTLRYRILLFLAEAPCYHGQLTSLLGVSSSRLTEVMEGGTESYPERRSLLPLGLVELIPVEGRKRYRITPAGREVLAEIAARRDVLKLPRLPA